MARGTRRSSSRSKSNKIAIPGFAGVETQVVIPEGEYLAAVKAIEPGEGENGPYLKWTFAMAEGDYEGKSAKPYYTSFGESSLWNLRSLLEALGVDTPDEPSEIDPEEILGLELMVSIEHDTYQGRKQSVVVDFWPAEDAEPEKDEKPARGSKKKDDDDDGDEKPARGRRSSKKDDDGDDEKDEKPAGRRGRGSSKKKESEKVSADDVEDMSQDELEELIKEHDLDVDLGEFRTIRKMRNAVIDALEEAGALVD